MDIRFVPVSEVTDLTRLKGTLTTERIWPFKLTGTDGSVIYLNVYESELRAVLKQISCILSDAQPACDIVEGLSDGAL
jgi:hypothetical protein